MTTRFNYVLNSSGILKIFILLLLNTLGINLQQTFIAMANTEQLQSDFSKNLETFSTNMYSKLVETKPGDNIIFSPFSIQTCAAMARIGATNKTAEELDRGLGLISKDVDAIADPFNKVLSVYEKSNILKIANKIYVMKGYTVKQKFNDILKSKFFSSADEIDFGQNVVAAKSINNWVESRTNNLIKDLISPDALDSATRLVLLNAIHFKGEWQHQFPKENTKDEDFYLNDTEKVKVPMMKTKERFRYAELDELDATALEMPYKDSDLSMLVILPNSRTGLKDLEKKLKNHSLSDITKQLFSTQVIVKFPKFKTEFSIELTDQFKQLGMTRMFSDEAEFDNMLDSREKVKVSSIIHKAFIEVNEEGTEAAAATAGKAVGYSSYIPEFTAEIPFIYVIKNSDNLTLFKGKITKF